MGRYGSVVPPALVGGSDNQRGELLIPIDRPDRTIIIFAWDWSILHGS